MFCKIFTNCMDIVLTESQYIRLLLEKSEKDLANVFTQAKDLTNKVVTDVKRQFGIDFKFLGTWGSVIGGFIGPINEYMQGRYPNLSESDISLICFGIMLTFFSSNEEKLKKVLEIIKEKGIITFFDRALAKAYDLKEAFFGFLESLNLTLSNVSNMIAYAFLIPLMPLLNNIVQMDLSQEQIDLIVTGLTHYTGLSVGSKLLKYIVEKILNRIKTYSDSESSI